MPLVITGADHREDDFHLDPEVISALWRMETGHFWHAARARWVAKSLRAQQVSVGAHILDIGCGSGAVSAYLHGLGYEVTGVDTAEPLVRKAHSRCPEATFVAGTVEHLPSPPRAYTALLFLDVLEHLHDPLDMIVASRRHATPGTLAVVTVPAGRALYTVVDELSGHHRRYELGEVRQLLERAGLVDVQERGIFRGTAGVQRRFRSRSPSPTGAELTAEQRRAVMLRNSRVPATPLNWGLRALCALEREAFFHVAVDRFGASLLVTARFP